MSLKHESEIMGMDQSSRRFRWLTNKVKLNTQRLQGDQKDLETLKQILVETEHEIVELESLSNQLTVEDKVFLASLQSDRPWYQSDFDDCAELIKKRKRNIDMWGRILDGMRERMDHTTKDRINIIKDQSLDNELQAIWVAYLKRQSEEASTAANEEICDLPPVDGEIKCQPQHSPAPPVDEGMQWQSQQCPMAPSPGYLPQRDMVGL